MKNKIERRYLAQEFRISDGDAPKIGGYAAKFGVRSEDLGGWHEVLAANCFDKSLASNPDVRALFNHDSNIVLGRTSAGTLRLSKDDTGLMYEVDVPDTSYARDLVVSMKRKDVTQSSFGFICHDAAWNYDEATGMDIRTVKEAELMDVSPVTFPAYTDSTSGVRSMPSDMPVEVRSKIEALRSGTDALIDNGCECECAECGENRCDACSNPECVDERCAGNHAARSWRETTELRLRLAQARTRAH